METANVEVRHLPMLVTNKDKWIIAIIIGLIFLLFAHRWFFAATNSLFAPLGLPTTNNNIPTLFGYVLHTLLFIIILRLLMH